MTTSIPPNDELGRFRALLDAFGSKPDRWPEPRRSEALALIAAMPEARAAVREAEALEHTLAAAPLVGDRRLAALADRITVAALTDNTAQSREPKPACVVVSLPARHPRSLAVQPRPAIARTARWHLGGVAAALAASLAFGMLLGASDPGSGPFRSLIDLTQADETQQLVTAMQGDELSIILEEDQL